MADKKTQDFGHAEITVAPDFRFVNVDLFGLAVTTKKDGSKNFAVSVFESILVPHFESGGMVGLKPVRQAVSTLAMNVDAAKALHNALERALHDLETGQDGEES